MADDDATAAGAQPHRSGVQPPGPGDAAGVAALAAAAPDEAEEAQPSGGSADGGSEREDLQILSPEDFVVRPRRGRPNRVLQEVLAEGRAEMANLVPAGQVDDPSFGEIAIRPLAGHIPRSLLESVRVGSIRLRPPWARGGWASLSQLASPLESAVEISQLGGARLDSETNAMANKVLDPAGVPLTSLAASALSLDVGAKKYSEVLRRLASAICLRTQSARAALESGLVRSMAQRNLLCYIDCARYDESSMKATVVGDAGDSMLAQWSSCAPSAVWLEAAQAPDEAQPDGGAMQLAVLGGPVAVGAAPRVGVGVLLPGLVRSDAMVAKLFQTLESFGCLLQARGRLVGIVGRCVTSVQVLGRTTEAVLKEALLRSSTASPACQRFLHKVRLVCSDRYKANIAAEQSIATERGKDWATLFNPCEVHMTAACHSKAFSLVDGHLSGLVNVALSLSHGAALSTFRQCLKDEVAARLQVLHGHPGREALEHKRNVLRLFLARGSNHVVRQALLWALPNGDWRNHAIEYWIRGPGSMQDRAVILRTLQTSLCNCLCPAKPPAYPRHRWTGADVACDCLGLLESCHGLLSSTYKRFMAAYSSRSLRSSVGALGPPAGLAGPQVVALPLMDDSERNAEDAAGLGEQKAPEAGGDPDWAAVNARERVVAWRWLSQKPLGFIILIRQAMEPLRVLLTSQLDMAADVWEVREQSKVAKAMKAGQPTEGSRKYRLSIAADLELEGRCYQQLSIAFNEERLWRILPECCYTFEFRALTFRVLSRIGCLVEYYLRSRHREWPFAIFRLLRAPAAAPEVLAQKPCPVRMDAWSASMLREHPTLSGPTFAAKLTLIATMAFTDISRIEARHAALRRHLVGKSVQCPTLSVANLGSLWVTQQVRVQEAFWRDPFHKPRPTSKRRGGGGTKAGQDRTEVQT